MIYLNKQEDITGHMTNLYIKTFRYMKYISLILIVLTVLTINVSAVTVQTLQDKKVYDCVVLPQDCPTCSFVTLKYIDVPAPNSSRVDIDTNMTNNGGGEFIYDCFSIPVAGEYTVMTYLNGNISSPYNFYATPSGQRGTSILDNSLFLILVLLSFASIGIGMTMRNPYFGFIGGIILGLAGVYTMIYGFGDITNLYTRGVATAFIGMGTFFFIVSAYEWTLGGGDDD